MKVLHKLMAFVAAGAVALSLSSCGEPESYRQIEGNYEGCPIASIEIEGYGTIKAALFQEECPKTVENFITHAEEGYYDGLTFHRVIADFMIQGGDPEGTGAGGESIWSEPFEDEFDPSLRNFRGALSMANSGKDTNGSQFFIVQQGDGSTYTEDYMKQLEDPVGALKDTAKELEQTYPKSQVDEWVEAQTSTINSELAAEKSQGYDRQTYPDEVKEYYAEVGGAPWLDLRHTVFGQVIEGMEIVDQIAGVNTDSNDKPLTDIVIKTITIEQP